MPYMYQLSAHSSIPLQGVRSVFHISRDKSTKLLASDENGTLVQTDTVSFNRTERKTEGRDEGYHTFTQKGEKLLHTETSNFLPSKGFRTKNKSLYTLKQIIGHHLAYIPPTPTGTYWWG